MHHRTKSTTTLLTLLLLCFAIPAWEGSPYLVAQESTEPVPAEEATDPPKPESDTPNTEPPADHEQAEQEEGDSKESDENPEQMPPAPENQETEDSTTDESKEGESENQRTTRKKRRQGNLEFSKQSDQFIAAFAPVVATTADSIVRIQDGAKQVAFGTIVDPDGFILTKASELRGALVCELADGTSLIPEIVGVDPSTDLVLLKVDKSGLPAIDVTDEQPPAVGSWLITIGHEEQPVAVGIVSHEARRIRNNVPNSAIIGIRPQDRTEGDGVRINYVFNDSPAEKSGLLVNDIIIGIDGSEVLNREQLLEKLSHYQPSDDIVLKIKRGEEVKDVPLTLGKRRTNPMMDRGVQQNRMGSILSKRRSNFPSALQHDSALNASECGGPVVDISGKVVGINIARDGRVSTLVLPNQVVLPVITRLKTGEYLPHIVNKDEIVRVEKQLAQLDKELGTLPDEKMKKELEKSAGVAVEDELQRQIEEVEAKLQALRERYRETRNANGKLKDEINDLRQKQERVENRREPLNKDLKRLKTGVQ